MTSILVAISALAYLTQFNALPAEVRNESETCETLGGYLPQQVEYGEKYSWAVPSAEAIEAIAAYRIPIVDFGAGSGLWASLVAAQGVDVVAYDNWSWGKPDELWFDVQYGNTGSLHAHSERAMLLVWPPSGSSMAIDALRAWDGDLLFYVGEIGRMNGTAEFVEALRDGWHLERRVDIPNWRGKVDELYILRRGNPDAGWMADAVSRCNPSAAAFFLN